MTPQTDGLSFASDPTGVGRVLPPSAPTPVSGGAPPERRPRKREQARKDERSRKPGAHERQLPVSTPADEPEPDADKGTRVDILA